MILSQFESVTTISTVFQSSYLGDYTLYTQEFWVRIEEKMEERIGRAENDRKERNR